MLEDQYGPENLSEIRHSLEMDRVNSPYFRDVQVHFRTLRGSGGTEMRLRREWQGRT